MANVNANLDLVEINATNVKQTIGVTQIKKNVLVSIFINNF